MAPPIFVDPKIWFAIAGPCTAVPLINSRVYYFPRGHLGEASSTLPESLSAYILPRPFVHSVISSACFLSNPETDEVYAYLGITPLPYHPVPLGLPIPIPDDGAKVVSFVKILHSDEVYPFGGQQRSAMLVPDALAELIFPPMDLQSDSQLGQTVTVTDLPGRDWHFCHYYNPLVDLQNKHIIIEGWGDFALAKKLVAGDAVVFVKKESFPGKIFVGIRRMVKGKVDPKLVEHAIKSAAANLPFEVMYTPSRLGWCDFVVRAEVVEQAAKFKWTTGMRAMMAVEMGEFSEVKWFQGTIIEIFEGTGTLWPKSPWRNLKMAWDEPAMILLNYKWVSPWQVKPVPFTRDNRLLIKPFPLTHPHRSLI